MISSELSTKITETIRLLRHGQTDDMKAQLNDLDGMEDDVADVLLQSNKIKRILQQQQTYDMNLSSFRQVQLGGKELALVADKDNEALQADIARIQSELKLAEMVPDKIKKVDELIHLATQLQQKENQKKQQKTDCKKNTCIGTTGGLLGGGVLSTTAALLSSELGMTVAVAGAAGFGVGAAVGAFAAVLIRQHCCSKKENTMEQPYSGAPLSRRLQKPSIRNYITGSFLRSSTSDSSVSLFKLMSPPADLESPLLPRPPKIERRYTR